MAKDGTNRGGPRVGAGRKSGALETKITEGRKTTILEFPSTPDLDGSDMPPVREYLKAKQYDGIELKAEEIFKDTWKWLKARHCDKIVNPQLIEQYAMSVARWIQCETAISEFGFIAKHPTTGAAIASPYVSMSREYMKQINGTWYQIFQVVRENSEGEYQGATPKDDLMEKLLSAK